jgi:Rrf2 family transcriptional regulator, iron-sulfur cluster assembly transcription factor
MRVLSKATVYGLRAIMYVAANNEKGNYVSIGEISEELDISFHFLTKTFQILTKNGICESHRGPHGGIQLKKSIDKIYLIDLVYILEGKDFFEKCLLGLPGCGSKNPCPVHSFWGHIRGSLQKEFEKTSLGILAKDINLGKMRL